MLDGDRVDLVYADNNGLSYSVGTLVWRDANQSIVLSVRGTEMTFTNTIKEFVAERTAANGTKGALSPFSPDETLEAISGTRS